ncbi:MAG: serine/threonine-protein kinase [Terriglobales bacterium]
MVLPAGAKLGPYEILSPLGAGGMGEVYRARDTRLDRTVAVKVLNSQLVGNVELRGRFEREAKIISQLQHPHICVLYDVGSEGSTEFLVMEFLEGESLADRLKRGPLAQTELLKIAIQIADALEKAHRAGVVHRDLKPVPRREGTLVSRTPTRKSRLPLSVQRSAVRGLPAKEAVHFWALSPTVCARARICPAGSPRTGRNAGLRAFPAGSLQNRGFVCGT